MISEQEAGSTGAPSRPRLAQVGRVVATEPKPNTAYEFHFWTAPGSPVGIGTLVVVLAENVEVYGVVVEGWSYTDVASAMHDYIGLDGDPAMEAMTRRPEIRCYTAAVLRREPEEPVQPVPGGPVYLADDLCVRRALRMDAYADRTGVAVGAYQNGELLAPVYLDADFLLGPEAAHVTLTGVSGLATKTSTIEFLLQSIFAARDDVACVCFNVKGHDMLFLDFPADAEPGSPLEERYRDLGITPLTEADRALYNVLGVPCRAFENVEYYAPFREDGFNLNTLRTNPEVMGNVHPLAWGLQDIMEFAEVVLSRDDVDAKADALIQYINQKVIGAKDGYNIGDGKAALYVRTFADLEEWFRRVFDYMEAGDNGRGMEQYRSHHYQTLRKVHNRLTNLITRYRGLLTPREERHDLPWGDFKPRTIYVVDIASMDQQGQDLVVTRVVSKLREHLERKALGVDRCIVVVDELNKYAPSDGPETNLKRTLLDISERGRYIGLVLFSAQQFRSQVHKRVVGNCGTSIYGRMDMDELATPGYQVLTRAEREKLATLSKGQLMVRHPHFSQAIFVKFPRPNVLRGSDGVRLFPPAEPVELEEAIFREFSRMDATVQRNQVREALADADRDAALEAFNKVRLRGSSEPVSDFQKFIRKKAKLDEPDPVPRAFGAPPPVSGDDPFAD
jgi:DNA helicase HerA-like ATPase